MKRPLLFIFSCVLAFLLHAQRDTTAVDTVRNSVDTATMSTSTSDKKRFIALSLNIDYGKLITTGIGLDEKYEAGLTFLFFEQYYMLAEYGQAVLSPENAIENGVYSSEGNYFRFGGGYLNQINPTSKLGLGVNYGQSNFQDQATYFFESPTDVQDGYEESFDRRNLEARWVEIMLTSESKLIFNKKEPESKINKLFSLGFYVRLRLLSSYDQFNPIDVYSIPGYGRVINDPVVAANLFVKFHPF